MVADTGTVTSVADLTTCTGVKVNNCGAITGSGYTTATYA